MIFFLIVLGVLVLMLLSGLMWGYFRLKNRQRDAIYQITSVTFDEIPQLLSECISTFKIKFKKEISLKIVEESANIIDDSLITKNRMKTITEFEKKGHSGWYIKPLGAFVGELIRINTGAKWVQAEGGGLALIVGSEPNTITFHPFDKINKHLWAGSPGDLTTYIKVALQGPDVLKNVIENKNKLIKDN